MASKKDKNLLMLASDNAHALSVDLRNLVSADDPLISELAMLMLQKSADLKALLDRISLAVNAIDPQGVGDVIKEKLAKSSA